MLVLLGLVAWLAFAAPVSGDTRFATFDPVAAAPGDRVEVRLDARNCTDVTADTLAMRLSRDIAKPADAVVHLRRVEIGRFAFEVPRLAPGLYWIDIECEPGLWFGLRVGGDPDHGPDQFTVLPDTSTVAAPLSSGVAAAAPPWLPILAGLVALVLVGRRRRPAA